MLIIDQLRISDDGKRMYINLHVNFASYFDNIMLDSITIVTADKVSETSPHTPSNDCIYKKVYTEDLQVDNIVIDKGMLDEAFNNWNGDSVVNSSKPHARKSFEKSNFSSDLFFIYVKCKGTPDACTPCRLDEEITIGVTFDEAMLYQRVMGYIKDLQDRCQIPLGFTDFILLWNAFKAAVETEHWIPAIRFWNMLFGKEQSPYGNGTVKGIIKNCGCHG